MAATLVLARRAGVPVFATGGIGGVHPPPAGEHPAAPDVSADLTELARVPVAVVCAGAKSVLDLPATLEVLETYSVPVVGYGTDEFPAFYVRSSGLPLAHRVNDALGAARIAKEQLARGAGMLVAVPIPAAASLDHDEIEDEVMRAIGAAERAGVRGAELTPYLLRALGEATGGRALEANVALLRANARVAAQLALALCA